MCVLHLVFKTKWVVSILLTLATNLLYTVFSTTSLFTTSLSLLKSTETGFNLCYLFASVFKLAIFDFSSKLEVSVPVAFFRSVFVA